MGNRQSSQQDQQDSNTNTNSNANNNNNDNNSTSNNERGRTMRPSSRLQAQRQALRSAVIPVNDNQRRDERRLRRERLREQQTSGHEPEEGETNEQEEEEQSAGERSLLSTVTEAMTAAAALRNNSNSSSSSSEATSEPNISPFSRMIASVISEAVITSFRNGYIPTVQPTASTNTTTTTTTPAEPSQTTQSTTTSNTNVRQQLTMHLSPEVFQQMEPGSTENSFMRFMRLPVIVTSVTTPNNSTADGESDGGPVNAEGQAPTLSAEESEVTRIIMLPVFLYGIRSSITQNTPATTEDNNTTEDSSVANDDTTQPIETTRRRSARIQAAQQQQQLNNNNNNNNRLPNGQWTVYIISGPNVDGIMSDNASYEELLDLASIIGPARLPTVSQEAIDNHVPIVKYSSQVKQTIVGNSEGCQICLNSYQSQDDLRILACHHGFHDDCICKWLTQGRNQCPLCRSVPIPTSV